MWGLFRPRNQGTNSSDQLFFIVVGLLLDDGCLSSEHCFFRERNDARLGELSKRKPSLKSHVTNKQDISVRRITKTFLQLR